MSSSSPLVPSLSAGLWRKNGLRTRYPIKYNAVDKDVGEWTTKNEGRPGRTAEGTILRSSL